MSWKDRSEVVKSSSSWKDRSEVVGSNKESGLSVRGAIKGAAESLPFGGAILGGGLGFLSPIPGGTIAGAGGGAAIGKTLENIIESQILDEPKTRSEIYLDPAKEAAIAAAGEGAGQIAGKALSQGASFVGKKALSGIKKASSQLSSIPEKTMETYWKSADKIDNLIKTYGPKLEGAPKAFKDNLQEELRSTFKKLSGKVGEIVNGPVGKKTVNISDSIEHLKKFRNELDPDFNASDIADIDEFLSTIAKKTENGEVPIKVAHGFKQFLYDQAKGTYQKGGQIAMRGKTAQKVANGAASLVKDAINQSAPELKAVNDAMANIHGFESELNKSLLAPSKSPGPLYAAGRGENIASKEMLQRAGDITGKDVLKEAEELAAAKAFSNPDMFSISQTGRSLLGAVTGQSVAGPLGAAAGGLLSSPAAIKGAIKSGLLTKEMIEYLNKKGAGILGNRIPGLVGRGIIGNEYRD